MKRFNGIRKLYVSIILWIDETFNHFRWGRDDHRYYALCEPISTKVCHLADWLTKGESHG